MIWSADPSERSPIPNPNPLEINNCTSPSDSSFPITNLTISTDYPTLTNNVSQHVLHLRLVLLPTLPHRLLLFHVRPVPARRLCSGGEHPPGRAYLLFLLVITLACFCVLWYSHQAHFNVVWLVQLVQLLDDLAEELEEVDQGVIVIYTPVAN